jgi:prenyltransferase beta subunit
MLQVARLAPKLLGDSAELVANYLQSLLNEDGGFGDRSGSSDLYYTAFAIGGLMALQQPLPVEPLARYLKTFGAGEELDLVYLACLARCWSALPEAMPDASWKDAIIQRIEAHRSADGGYNVEQASERGTVYGCFLALGAYQDLKRELPAPADMLACIKGLRCPDGSYSNSAEMSLGLTPPSAAAAALLRHLGEPYQAELQTWLLARFNATGGFCVTPAIVVPDLLSTATALHALGGLDAEFERIKEPCLDFIDSLWNARGGFHGSWEDDELDCEYTYYGLLALGHLSL